MRIATIPMTRTINQKVDTLNSESIILDDVINFGLIKYAINESKVETMIIKVSAMGKKLSSKSIKASVIIPRGILKALPSLIGIKKIMIPNNEGKMNFNKPDLVI